MNTHRGILNFFKKVNISKQPDESECEDCATDVEPHNTDKIFNTRQCYR